MGRVRTRSLVSKGFPTRDSVTAPTPQIYPTRLLTGDFLSCREGKPSPDTIPSLLLSPSVASEEDDPDPSGHPFNRITNRKYNYFHNYKNNGIDTAIFLYKMATCTAESFHTRKVPPSSCLGRGQPLFSPGLRRS